MQKSEFVQRAWACERKLYRIARTMLSSDADCEDAVQEALLKAWAKIHTLRESAWFETWLVRILINECRQIWRKRPRAEVELIDNITADIPEGTPVTEAILALPPKSHDDYPKSFLSSKLIPFLLKYRKILRIGI